MTNAKELLKNRLSPEHLDKLLVLNNDEVTEFVAYAIELCEPDSVWVGNDSDTDAAYCRQLSMDNKEELLKLINEELKEFIHD